jgi:hypothetical protein
LRFTSSNLHFDWSCARNFFFGGNNTDLFRGKILPLTFSTFCSKSACSKFARRMAARAAARARALALPQALLPNCAEPARDHAAAPAWRYPVLLGCRGPWCYHTPATTRQDA